MTIIRHTVYSSEFYGRIAAIPSATTGGLLSPLVISGRTIIADSSLSASAVTGHAIHTGVITGTDGIPTAGTAIIHRNMQSPATLTITIITTPYLRAKNYTKRIKSSKRMPLPNRRKKLRPTMNLKLQ